MSDPTHYQVLGVAPSATVDQVRAAYRAQARRHHPDAGGAAASMQRLNAAFYVLRDPGRRATYDRQLAQSSDTVAQRWSTDESGHEGWMPAAAASDEGDVEDLLDTHPIGPTQALDGWWALAPPASLVAAIGLGIAGIFFISPALLVFSVAAFFVSLGLFVLAPLRAMTRSPGRRR